MRGSAGGSFDPIDIEVGHKLRQLRKDRRMNQGQLGGALGITSQQIQKYEQGSNRISASMIWRAARALGVQPSEIIPRTDAEPLSASARLLSSRGAEKLLDGYAAIRSPLIRRAVLILVRALGAVESGGGTGPKSQPRAQAAELALNQDEDAPTSPHQQEE